MCFAGSNLTCETYSMKKHKNYIDHLTTHFYGIKKESNLKLHFCFQRNYLLALTESFAHSFNPFTRVSATDT